MPPKKSPKLSKQEIAFKKSAAAKARLEKIKSNPVLWAEYKEKERLKYFKKIEKGQRKLVQDMNPHEKQKIRKKWKTYSSDYRKTIRKKCDDELSPGNVASQKRAKKMKLQVQQATKITPPAEKIDPPNVAIKMEETEDHHLHSVKEEIIDDEYEIVPSTSHFDPVKSEPDMVYFKPDQEVHNRALPELENPLDLDPVDMMFLDFARRFKEFDSKRQLSLKSGLCELFTQAEMEEMDDRPIC